MDNRPHPHRELVEMSKKIDLTGQKFNRLTVIKDLKKRTKNGHAVWLCHCICGNLSEVCSDRLRSGNTQSCGCLSRERMGKGKNNPSFKHGDAIKHRESRLYRIWTGMKARCCNPNKKNYRWYGERGISICNEWKHDFLAFKEWALVSGYQIPLTIDRKNSNGNYKPSNCQWLTRSENTKKGKG